MTKNRTRTRRAGGTGFGSAGPAELLTAWLTALAIWLTGWLAAWRTILPSGRTAKRQLQAGFTLIEVLGALAVASLAMLVLAGLWRQGAAQMEQAGIAWHLREVVRAGQEYAREHHATLLERSTQTSGPDISVADMVDEGLLPEGFSALNGWSQTVRASFRKTSLPDGSERLTLFVLTSGGRGTDWDEASASFFHVEAPAAARRAGSSAGYIAAESSPSGHEAGMLVSAYGGYAADLETWGLVSPGPGHLGAWVSCEAESDSDSVLWRVAVDGSPELNRMETEIDMNDHGLNNTGWVQFTSWAAGDAERPVASGAACTSDELGRLFLDADYGLYLCRQVEGSATPELVLVGDSGNSQSVRHATLATDGDLVAKPVCSAEAGQTAQIFLAPAIASSGPTSPPMAAFRAWAEEESEGWRVRLKVKNTSHSDVADWYSPTDEGESLAPYYGSAMVLTMCVRAAE